MNEHKDEVFEELRRLYPAAAPELHFSNPYETLVATILSAQCTDRRVNQVTPAVFRDFPDVRAMAETTPEILHEYVKSCGISKKAANIVNACRMICEKYGGEVPHTMEELTALPGVGRQTANVVLAFAFNIPAFPVDTHVFRLSHRLDLSQGGTPDKVEQDLCAIVPKEDWQDMHHRLIFHGRRVCHAQRPDCARCTLCPFCPWPGKNGPEPDAASPRAGA